MPYNFAGGGGVSVSPPHTWPAVPLISWPLCAGQLLQHGAVCGGGTRDCGPCPPHTSRSYRPGDRQAEHFLTVYYDWLCLTYTFCTVMVLASWARTQVLLKQHRTAHFTVLANKMLTFNSSYQWVKAKNIVSQTLSTSHAAVMWICIGCHPYPDAGGKKLSSKKIQKKLIWK